MDGRWRDGEVVVGQDARQRFYDSRGYGRPLGGNDVALAPVEAAHLLFRGDLDAVDGMGFEAFLERATETADRGFVARFLVYADFRDRGFYLSPAHAGWVADPEGADLVVYPRGKGPWQDAVAYRVRVVGERATVPAADLDGAVLAVVDEESEITYFETGEPDLGRGTDDGSDDRSALPSGVDATLLDDRVVAWEPPAALHEDAFYGQPLAGRDASGGALQLSLVEAAFLAGEGALALDAAALCDRGRAVEGDRFDRRLRAYRALRDAGLVPKTGFKFGADFRVYTAFDSVDDVGHSAYLVRVLPADHAFESRDLALDVRLAHGVRKRMVFGLVGRSRPDGEPRDGRAGEEGAADGVTWRSVERLTP